MAERQGRQTACTSSMHGSDSLRVRRNAFVSLSEPSDKPDDEVEPEPLSEALAPEPPSPADCRTTGALATRGMKGASLDFDGCAEGNGASVLRKLRKFLEHRSITLPELLGADDERRPLTVNEIREALWNNGLVARNRDITALVEALDDDGEGNIPAALLLSAYKYFAAGEQDWADLSRRDAQAMIAEEPSPEPSKVGAHDGLLPLWCGDGWPTEVLQAIQNHLNAEHIRITELFRSTWYNKLYRECGEEAFDSQSLSGMLEKAGYYLSPGDAKYVTNFLGGAGDGLITIDVLTAALRATRRGHCFDETEWRSRSPSPVMHARMGSPGTRSSPSSVGSPGCWTSGFELSERIQDLHALHKAKHAKLRAAKEMQEAREERMIEDSKLAARTSRSSWRCSDGSRSPSPHKTVQRLQEAGQHRERKLRALAASLEERDRHDLEARRVGPTPLAQKFRAASPSKDVVQRLYERHSLVAKKKEKLKAEIESKEIESLSLGQRGRTGSPPTRAKQQEMMQRLYDDGKEKLKQKEAARMTAEADTEKALRENSPQRKVDEERIDRLYQKHAIKLRTRAQDMKKREAEEQQKFREEAEAWRKKTATATAAVDPRVGSPKEAESFHFRWRTEETKKEVQSRSRTPMKIAFDRATPPPREPVCHVIHPELSDVVLASVNSVVALRCGVNPEEVSPMMLSGRAVDMKEVLEAYRRAQRTSDSQPGGAGALREMRSKRLYAGGYLMQDLKGYSKMIEPDPIRQLDEDLDTLLTAAECAQTVLVNMFGPPPGRGQEWRAGKFERPRHARSALFAYNPGVKSRDAAERKAFVRYGPATRERRFSHVLDLARIGLVFKNSIDILLAIRDIHECFEVVQVRNFYCPSIQNHVGERWVEICVVVTEGLPQPHVCEIRLEEQCFFDARMATAAHIQSIAQGFSEVYQIITDGMVRGDAVQYLVQWALRRPKDSPALSRFRRKLAGKFRSNVSAWRRAFKNQPNVSFHDFRTMTMMLQCQKCVVEFWEALDCTRSGIISLLELDAEAVMLLARFRARLIGFFERDGGCEDALLMMSKMASLASVKLATPGRMAASEFRYVAKVFDFDTAEADLIFSHLDATAGSAMGHVLPADFMWLLRFPRLLDFESLALAVDERSAFGHERAKVQVDHLVMPRAQFCKRPSYLSPRDGGRRARSASPPSHCILIPAALPPRASSPPIRRSRRLSFRNMEAMQRSSSKASKDNFGWIGPEEEPSPSVASSAAPLPSALWELPARSDPCLSAGGGHAEEAMPERIFASSAEPPQEQPKSAVVPRLPLADLTRQSSATLSRQGSATLPRPVPQASGPTAEQPAWSDGATAAIAEADEADAVDVVAQTSQTSQTSDPGKPKRGIIRASSSFVAVPKKVAIAEEAAVENEGVADVAPGQLDSYDEELLAQTAVPDPAPQVVAKMPTIDELLDDECF